MVLRIVVVRLEYLVEVLVCVLREVRVDAVLSLDAQLVLVRLDFTRDVNLTVHLAVRILIRYRHQRRIQVSTNEGQKRQ